MHSISTIKRVNMTNLFSPINIKAWINQNRELLKPPVGNKCIYENGDYIVMVVGGPNARKDFHYNETPEFFYQIEGDITLKLMENGKEISVPIKEGEIYLLPPKVPHSPQRGANTVGLVIESKRAENMHDALQWYCEECANLLYEEQFTLDNIETDMPKIFSKFYGDNDLLTCSKCSAKMAPPK